MSAQRRLVAVPRSLIARRGAALKPKGYDFAGIVPIDFIDLLMQR